MEERNIDLYPAYIPFEKQAQKADGTIVDPGGSPTVSIYEESGADAAFDNSQVAGSPFACAKINAKTGNFGVLVSKALFTVGKIYRIRYEWTVDGIAAAFEESFLAVESDQKKADVSAVAIEANVRGHADDALTAYDPPTRAEATSDKDEILSGTDDIYDKTDDIIGIVTPTQADVSAILIDTNEMQGKLPAAAIAGEAEATINHDILTAMLRYLNGEGDYNIATVAVPARNVDIGMLDTIDMAISATQVLHIELTYNANKNVVSKAFTVV